ncbi:MAG: TVP38/TMEM64 family protein [Methylohalobius sp. ZOD2]
MGAEKSRIPRIIGLAGVAITFALGVWVWFFWDQESFSAWQKEAGPVPFFIALAVLPAVGFPTTPFYLLAGATYGTVVALTGAALSLAINLTLCYWVAHSGLRRLLARWLARTRYELPAVRPDQALLFTLLVKLMPGIPTFVKNYLLGVSGVRFPLYFLVSFTFTLVYGAVFIELGESLYEHDFSQAVGAVSALAVLAFVLGWFRLRIKRRIDKADTSGR